MKSKRIEHMYCPLEGNRFFEGSGMHLPGGAPELVIDSIPAIDVPHVKTIT